MELTNCFFNNEPLNLLFWYEDKNKNEYGNDANEINKAEKDRIQVRNYKIEYWLYQIKYTIARKNAISKMDAGEKDFTIDNVWKKSENPILLIQTHAYEENSDKKIDYFCDKFKAVDFDIENDFYITLPKKEKNNDIIIEHKDYYEKDYNTRAIAYLKQIIEKEKQKSQLSTKNLLGKLRKTLISMTIKKQIPKI